SRRELATMLANRGDVAATRDELARAAVLAVGCPNVPVHVRDVFVAAQVARDEDVPAVRAEIAAQRAAPAATPSNQALLDQIEGQLLLGRDRAAATALLERAIAAATPRAARDVDAHKARSYAYSNLVLDAGRAGEWPRVWQLLRDESGAAVERCGLGVAVEAHRSVVVVRDATGAPDGLYQGARTEPDADAAHLVPASLIDRLRGCAEIDVVARPPSQGAPALLPHDLAWSYRSSRSAPGSGPSSRTRLVISQAEPPAELGLPRLLPWRSAQPPDVALEGAAATPSHALAALASAGFVEIHAHGMVNTAVADASFVMLSPDPDGRFALTAAAVRQQPLRGRPVVILAACHAGATASYRHEPWGLPAAFIEAGARAVIGSPDTIADVDAGAWFDALRARIEGGASPAQALRDQRLAWLAAHPDAAWLRSLMVFQ
ncbi:MAG TPA: CHAT domain-containing protein, partial [Kofleriaceae bacterium]|nr:CHAT domain-containing protein [Kofleriaceae bacterium]